MASLFDLNSDDSDSENDCDYVPQVNENCDDSEDNSSCDDLDSKNVPDEKMKKRKKKSRKKTKENDRSSDEIEVKPEMTPEEEKRRADDLWNDFQKDVKFVPKRPITKPVPSTELELKNCTEVKPSDPVIEKSKVIVTEVFDFAGEEVKVTKEVDIKTAETNKLVTTQASLVEKSGTSTVPSNVMFPKRPAKGLSAVLGALSKKPKLSTLQKSLHDWNSFKHSEGIEEELEHHNKGKEGFLEKQAFLQRSDLRQFEIEKSIRNFSRRTNL